MIDNLGPRIYECFSTVESVGREVDAINRHLPGLIEDKLIGAGYKPFEQHDEWRQSDNGWVPTDYIWAVSFSKKSNNRDKLWLGYQISLSGDCVNYRGCKAPEPLVHVFLWSDIDSAELGFSGGNYMGFPLEPYQGLKLTSNSLIEWPITQGYNWFEKENLRGWTFSIRLTSLNQLEDLETLIVKPAIKLIDSNDVNGTLGNLKDKGLVWYDDEIIPSYSAEDDSE